MIYDWYKIFNKTDFDATGLTSKTYELFLVGIGLKYVLVTKGNLLSMTIDDVFLSLELNSKNPFYFSGRGIYVDPDENVFWGIPRES
jgi:hypothetical protein